MRDKNNELVKVITRSSFAVGISIICLLLFRGPISIASTFLIPPIIVLFSNKVTSLYYLLTSIGLLLNTIVIFPTQLVFVFTYLILAMALAYITKKGDKNISRLQILLYFLLTIAALFIGIRLTQVIYMIPLHTMMLRLSNGSYLFYFFIVFVEALIVCIFNFGLLKLFKKRIFA